MESYILARSEEAAAAHGHRAVAATLLPQLGVRLAAEPNKTCWTVAFQCLFHLAAHVPLEPRPRGWQPSRGGGDSFALQARGTVSYNGEPAFRRWGANGAVQDVVKPQCELGLLFGGRAGGALTRGAAVGR
jgi:hypothetical protein